MKPVRKYREQPRGKPKGKNSHCDLRGLWQCYTIIIYNLKPGKSVKMQNQSGGRFCVDKVHVMLSNKLQNTKFTLTI